MKRLNRHGRTLTPSICVVITESMIRFARLARATFESSCLLLETIAPGAVFVNTQAIPARGRQFKGKGESGTMNGKITIINPTADDFITLGTRVQALGYVLVGAIRDGAPALEHAAAALIDYGYIINNISTDNYDALNKALSEGEEKNPKKAALRAAEG